MAKNYIEKTRSPSTRIFPLISLIIKGPRSDDFSEWCLEIDQTQQPSRETRGYYRKIKCSVCPTTMEFLSTSCAPVSF